MPDRSVTYEFRAKFDSFRAQLAAGGKSVDDFGKKLTALDKDGAKMRQGLSRFGDIGGKIALGAAAGLTAIVAVTANFDKAMSGVKAATGEGEAGMKALREAAIQAGADTAFSASEAAAGIENLAKAGVSTADILGGGLQGALDLAAAGEIDVAVAAEAAASAMTQFGLAGADVPHIADLLAAAAGKAQGEVTDMAAALNQSGLIADQVGLSIEETAGGLAAFASAGLLGSDAGTSFKTMLGALTPNSAKAKAAMDELGISAYDAQGNFIGLSEFAGNLQAGLADLTDEQRQSTLETIFGSDAVRAASILYEQGADGIQTWIDKTNDAGFASEQAATRLDNLAGDFEALTGSLETALIGAGEGSQGPLRSLVQGLTDVVNAFNGLPGPAQSAVTALLGVTTLLGGGLWATSKVVTGIANTKQALADLGVEAGRTRGILGGLAKAGAGLATLEAVTFILDKLTATLEKPLDTGTLNRDLEALSDGRLTDAFEDLGIWLDDIDEKAQRDWNPIARLTPLDMSGFEDAERELAKIDESLAGMVESGNVEQAAAAYDVLSEKAEEAGLSQREFNQTMEEYRTALLNAGLDAPGAFLSDFALAADGAADATGNAADATSDLGGASRRASAGIGELTNAMLNARDAALSAFDAETRYREALKAARAQAAANTAGINGNSKAALENRNALSTLATAWNNQSGAVRNNTEKFKEAKAAFIQTAVAMGVPRQAAEALARQLLALPKSKVIPVSVPGADEAANKVHGLISALSSVRDKVVHITTVFERKNIDINRASGGYVSGPGTETSDSIPAMLSDGEYVIRAAAVRKYGIGTFDRLNALRLADGGPVAPVYTRGGDNSTERESRETGRALKGLRAELKRTTEALEKERQERDKVVEKMESLSSDVSGDLRSSLFAGNVWSGDGSGSATLRGDIAQGRLLEKTIDKLKAKGLSGGALAEVLAEGGLQGAQAYASMTRAELNEFERLFNLRNRVLRSVGQQAGSAAYGAQLRESNRDVRELKQEVKQIKHLLAKGNKDRKDEHGKDRDAQKRGAGNGQRNRRRDR